MLNTYATDKTMIISSSPFRLEILTVDSQEMTLKQSESESLNNSEKRFFFRGILRFYKVKILHNPQDVFV